MLLTVVVLVAIEIRYPLGWEAVYKGHAIRFRNPSNLRRAALCRWRSGGSRSVRSQRDTARHDRAGSRRRRAHHRARPIVCHLLVMQDRRGIVRTCDVGHCVACDMKCANLLNESGDPKFRQLEPARRLAASGRPSATSGVSAVGTLRPYHIWCHWLRWPSASYTELVTQVVAGQVLEHVHRLALLVPVAEVDRADCFCELDRSGV